VRHAGHCLARAAGPIPSHTNQPIESIEFLLRETIRSLTIVETVENEKAGHHLPGSA
jgi:hypothetical protein